MSDLFPDLDGCPVSATFLDCDGTEIRLDFTLDEAEELVVKLQAQIDAEYARRAR